MLRWRLVSSLPLIAGLLSLMYVDWRFPYGGVVGLWLVPLVIGCAVCATYEVLDLLGAGGFRPARKTVYGGTLLVLVAAYAPELSRLAGSGHTFGAWESTCVALALATMAIFAAEMRRFERPGHAVSNVAAGVLVVMYVGGLLSFLVALRLFGGNSTGIAALLSLLVIVKMSDTGAYFTGKSLGRRKLAPVLSPGKTIEGLIGGLAAAAVTSVVFFRWAVPAITGTPGTPAFGRWLAFGLLVGAFGVVGDLSESLLKRDMGRKDSSSLIPGLGGVLDILDSLLFAAPAAYLGWACGLVGT